MGQRLVKTVRTPEAVEYQLHRHPLGPVRLAEAMLQESNTEVFAASRMEQARVQFSLLEIALMMTHAGKRLHKLRQKGEADHRPCFRSAVARVFQQAAGLMPTGGPTAAGNPGFSASLRRYRDSVYEQAETLLKGPHYEEATACQ